LSQPELTNYPILLRITVLPKVLFTYLRLLFLPVNLHMSRTLIRPVSAMGIFLSWVSLAVIFAACAYILIYKKERKIVSFLLFWSLVFLIPQSGIFPINAFVAEHFIYLPSISFFTAISYLLRKYLRKGLFIFSVAGLVIFYGSLTLSRNFEWRDPVIFYERIIRFSPDSFLAHNNLGVEYEDRGKYEKALKEFNRASEIKPGRLEAHYNLANIYYKMGRFQESEREYRIVEKIAPHDKAAEVQSNIGMLYEAQGRMDKALDRFRLALRIDSGLVFTHFNIARVYLARADYDSAAIEIAGSLTAVPADIGRDKQRLGIIANFLKEKKNISCSPTFYNDLGVKFANAGSLDEAINAFTRALDLASEYADAHFNLGLAYWKRGLRREAIREFKTTLKIDRNHLRAKRFLSEVVYKISPRS
ncbi:MAG: tetratricopeptide repeat protein, partial [Candidatus Omnitrophica bacterium]|nr:tetratricopeptide repeat protein [Candidatus Omnitrophota bacterium]